MLRRFCHHSHQDAFMPWPALPDRTQPHTWPHMVTSSHTVAHLISQLVTPGHTLSHLMGPFHGHAWSHLVTLCSTVAPGAEARSLTALLGGKHGVNMLVKHLGQNAAAILSHLVGAGHGGSVYGGGWGLVAHVIPFPPPYVAGAVMQTGTQAAQYWVLAPLPVIGSRISLISRPLYCLCTAALGQPGPGPVCTDVRRGGQLHPCRPVCSLVPLPARGQGLVWTSGGMHAGNRQVRAWPEQQVVRYCT